MGSLYARIAGPNNAAHRHAEQRHLPGGSGQPRTAVADELRNAIAPKARRSRAKISAPITRYFDPSGGGELRQNLELRITRERLTDRRNLLTQLDTFRRQADRTHAFDSASAYEQQAYDLLLRGVAQAFDLSREDPRLVSPLRHQQPIQPGRRSIAWGDMRRSSNLLGKQMLLARRLVESGLRLRHRHGRRLGHALQQQQPAQPGRHVLARPAGRSCRLRVSGRRRSARPERQDSADRHRRNGPHAAHRRQRRPRPLGQPDAAPAWRAAA